MVIVTCIAGSAVGWRMSAVDRLGKSRRFVRAMLIAICVSTMIPAIGVIWARYRWLAMWELWETWGQANWPQPWPYPDRLLDSYAAWLDARNPPPPGHFKLHGEYYTVHVHIFRIVFPLLALASLAFGLATPELGRWVWRQVRTLVKSCFKRMQVTNRMEER
jgi:hypothetical protein